ncbi:hypothetical protein K9M74_02065 [Candidatus Woesearchaeota archaeon]|nr:hypothetical protein [Candidatus Woesearchaeota archaeon]
MDVNNQENNKMKKTNTIDVNEQELIDIVEKYGYEESEHVYILHKPLDKIPGYENKQIQLPVAFQNSAEEVDVGTYMWTVFTNEFYRGEAIKDPNRIGEKTHHSTNWEEELAHHAETERMIGGCGIQEFTYESINASHGETAQEAINNQVKKYINSLKKVELDDFYFLRPNTYAFQEFQKHKELPSVKKFFDLYAEVKNNIKKTIFQYK